MPPGGSRPALFSLPLECGGLYASIGPGAQCTRSAAGIVYIYTSSSNLSRMYDFLERKTHDEHTSTPMPVVPGAGRGYWASHYFRFFFTARCCCCAFVGCRRAQPDYLLLATTLTTHAETSSPLRRVRVVDMSTDRWFVAAALTAAPRSSRCRGGERHRVDHGGILEGGGRAHGGGAA